MKRLFFAAAAALIIGGGIFAYLLFSNPHMKRQPHILSYEQTMQLPPPGIVPVEEDLRVLPSPEKAARMLNPVVDNPRNRARSKIYYDYYCVFCHGESGRGDGPVGYGYMPMPTDLLKDEILKKSDGELMLAMLTGVGHEPVLVRIVPAAHRWYIVLHVRNLWRLSSATARTE